LHAEKHSVVEIRRGLLPHPAPHKPGA
jgi:hypothetical protein